MHASPSHDAKVAALARIPLFSLCGEHQLEAIAAVTEVVRVPAGSALVESGRAASHVHVVVAGEAVMRVDGEPVATLGPGDVVAEYAVVDDSPMRFGVTASVDMTLWQLARSRFADLEHEDSDLAVVMLAGLVARLRETNVSLTPLSHAATVL